MNGMRVKIRGSRRIWRVARDTGYDLLIVHGSSPAVACQVRRTEVRERYESGIGWVPTEMEEG